MSKKKHKTKGKEKAQALTTATLPEVVPAQKPRRILRPRRYDMAVTDHTNASWRGEYYEPNQAIRQHLERMRARSRDLWQNNDYAKAFGRQLKTNVFGPKGIIHQSKLKNSRGGLAKTINNQIELAYRIQSNRMNWSVDKQQSRASFGRRWLEALARDGAVLIRVHRNFAGNATGFALELLECDYLIDTLYETAPNGNQIKGGVEFNRFGQPVAYHLYAQHPGGIYGRNTKGVSSRERFSADDMIYSHYAEDERPGQVNGVPWVHSAATRLRQVGQYEQAQLVAAVVSSRKMGFLSPSMEAAGLYSGDPANDGSGDIVSEVAAGTIEELPPGYEFSTFDPTFPHDQLPEFIKAMVRGAAAGLGPSYHSLSGDLESVNYSSIRAGQAPERDYWRVLQDFAIEQYEREVMRRWLEHQLLAQAIPVTFANIEAIYEMQKFQPRGWQYVDVQKEVAAAKDAISGHLSSHTLELAKLGLDAEDLFEQIAQDRELAASYGIDLTMPEAPAQTDNTQQVTGNEQNI